MGIFVDHEEFNRKFKECKYIDWIKILRNLLIVTAITFSVTYILLFYLLEIVITGEAPSFSSFFSNDPPTFNFTVHFLGFFFTILNTFEMIIPAFFTFLFGAHLYTSPLSILHMLTMGCFHIYFFAEIDDSVTLCRLLILLILAVTHVWLYFCGAVYHDTMIGARRQHRKISKEKKNVSEEKKNVAEEEKNVPEEKNNVPEETKNETSV